MAPGHCKACAVGDSVLRKIALLIVLLGLMLAVPQARQTVWFNETFDTPTADCEYGFGFFYGTTCTGGGTSGGESPYWSFEHVANGDADGSGAARLTKLAGADQYSMGWSVTSAVLNHHFSLGDHYYVRLRVRLDDSWRFTAATSGCFDGSGSIACAANMQTKFFGMGDTGTPQSRVIMFLQSPQGNFGCMLGSSPSNPGVGTAPSDFGLSGADWLDAALLGKYGSFSVHTNTGAVADGCVGPVLTTYGNNGTFPASPNGASPSTVNGWQYLQFYVKSGTSSNAEYKIWANNNTLGTPTYSVTGFNLDVVNWDSGFVIGWQTTGPLAADASYKIGEIEIGDSFGSTWYPGTGGATTGSARIRVRGQ